MSQQNQQPQGKYSAKTHTKIAIWVLMIGWFPMMFICAWGVHLEPTARMLIFFSSFIICGAAGMSMIVRIGNPAFWRSFEDIEELRNDYRIFKAKYQKALQEFAINQKVEIDEESESKS